MSDLTITYQNKYLLQKAAFASIVNGLFCLTAFCLGKGENNLNIGLKSTIASALAGQLFSLAFFFSLFLQ